jgi:sulfonate transport system permease protein
MNLRIDPRGAVLPLAALLVWSSAGALGWTDPRLVPPPQQVLASAWNAAADGRFLAGLGASLLRDAAGFTLGATAGLALGLAMGLSRWAERLVGPSFHVLRQVALFAWLPLLASLLGSGEPARVVFIALSAFYPVALASFEGVRAIPRTQWELARLYGLRAGQRLRRLVLPGAAPQILAGLHLGLLSAWLATIGAEYLLPRQGVGLGDTLIRGRAVFDVALVLFGMGVVGLVGASLDRAAGRVEARLLRWRGGRR